MLFTGFFILLCTSGLIGIMQYLSKNIPGFWKLFQMFLFCLMAACFYVYPQFYPGDAFNEQLHMVMSCSVIAGALVNAINIMLKNKAAAFISVFCFFIAGTLLVQFREDPKVFSRQQEYTSSMSSFSGNINLGPVSAVQK